MSLCFADSTQGDQSCRSFLADSLLVNLAACAGQQSGRQVAERERAREAEAQLPDRRRERREDGAVLEPVAVPEGHLAAPALRKICWMEKASSQKYAKMLN